MKMNVFSCYTSPTFCWSSRAFRQQLFLVIIHAVVVRAFHQDRSFSPCDQKLLSTRACVRSFPHMTGVICLLYHNLNGYPWNKRTRHAQGRPWCNHVGGSFYINHHTETEINRLEDDIFEFIFVYENCILILISLNFVPKCPIGNTSGLVRIAAWRRTGDNPSSEFMMAKYTDTCARATRPW